MRLPTRRDVGEALFCGSLAAVGGFFREAAGSHGVRVETRPLSEDLSHAPTWFVVGFVVVILVRVFSSSSRA
jgi:hypothetical protein